MPCLVAVHARDRAENRVNGIMLWSGRSRSGERLIRAFIYSPVKADDRLIMAALCNRGAIIFLPVVSIWSPCVIGQTIIFMAALRSRCGHYIFAL